MKIFACFPSKYLKAADLCDRNITVLMSHVALEDVGNEDAKLLPVLYFKEVPKGMVLNKTNAKAISAAYGDETDAWTGRPIVLFSAMVAFGSEVVEAIRLKAPAPRHGGPTSRERQTAAITAAADPQAAAEAIIDNWSQTNADRMRRAMASNSPEPAARMLNEMFARAHPEHDADGVIWDDAAERVPTEAEKSELLRESLVRANAALDERKEARGALRPDDGLDIPAAFDRRPKPPEPDYGPNAWIELMQAAE